MFLQYENKKDEKEFLSEPSKSKLVLPKPASKNLLMFGDNVEAMKSLLDNGYAGKVDLEYLDPPFATNNTFSVGDERVSTISRSGTDRIAYEDHLTGEKFLEFLRLRLILLRELLSEQGSIYLHIDYKIGHYVKIIMDEVFGADKFKNDITRIKCNPKNFTRSAYGNIKDMILFYSKGKKPIWNDPREPMTNAEIVKRFNKIDDLGRRYTTVPIHAPGETKKGPSGMPWRGMLPPKGRHWRCSVDELEQLDADGLIEWSKTGNPRRIIYADDKKNEGKKMQDIWTFKDFQYPQYPTEKNLGLLEHIVKASSNPNSIVMDCFCGSGTTLVAAEEFKRKWIGIDKSPVAMDVCKKKLQASYTRIDL